MNEIIFDNLMNIENIRSSFYRGRFQNQMWYSDLSVQNPAWSLGCVLPNTQPGRSVAYCTVEERARQSYSKVVSTSPDCHNQWLGFLQYALPQAVVESVRSIFA